MVSDERPDEEVELVETIDPLASALGDEADEPPPPEPFEWP